MNYHDYWKIGKMFKHDGIVNEEFNTMMEKCRCPKCIYEGSCRDFDKNGSCKKYKRDPPDGGYYG